MAPIHEHSDTDRPNSRKRGRRGHLAINIRAQIHQWRRRHLRRSCGDRPSAGLPTEPGFSVQPDGVDSRSRVAIMPWAEFMQGSSDELKGEVHSFSRRDSPRSRAIVENLIRGALGAWVTSLTEETGEGAYESSVEMLSEGRASPPGSSGQQSSAAATTTNAQAAAMRQLGLTGSDAI